MTGEPGFERVHGSGLFEWLAEHPDASATFDAHMTAMTGAEVDAVVAAAPLPDTGTVVDVAGGRGTLLAAILRARPGLRGVLFDLPHVAENARRRGTSAARSSPAASSRRCRPARTSTRSRTSCTTGTTSARSRSCARCAPRSRTLAGLLVIERVIPPGDTPAPGKLVDVTMLLITGGRERTHEQYRRLLAEAGFRIDAIAPTAAGTDVISACPA